MTKTGMMNQNWWNHLELIVCIKIGGRAWYRVDEHNSHDGEEEEVKAEVTSYDYFYQKLVTVAINALSHLDDKYIVLSHK